MTIGERLKQLRGLNTQKSFANKLGISSQAIINYEKYGRIPNERIISLICERFGVSRGWLVNGEDDSTVDSAGTKSLTCQRFCELENSQHTENTDSELQKTSDVSEVLAVQLELNTAYKATAALQRELTEAIRENADLRVELERRKAQIRDLERENADLRKAMKPARLPGMDGQGVA